MPSVKKSQKQMHEDKIKIQQALLDVIKNPVGKQIWF